MDFSLLDFWQRIIFDFGCPAVQVQVVIVIMVAFLEEGKWVFGCE